MNKIILALVTLCALVVFYFSGVGFGLGFLGQVFFAGVVFSLLYIAGKGGWERFYLVALAAASSMVSLGCSFLSPTGMTGPFVTDFRMSPLMILIVSVFVGGLSMYWYDKSKHKDKFAFILLAVFILNWLILGINVRFFDDWKIENWLTVPFVVLMYIAHRWFKLSNVSYGLIFAYTMLHIYGSHYTYAEVPFGYWMQNAFELGRNHYDRIVHFSFGFLLAYPLREVVLRVSDAKGFWGLWFPVEFVLAFSAIYEILEWWVAEVFGGDLGVAYLGSQGDVWDAQKDMLLAGFGSVITMFIVFVIISYFKRREFWKEFKGSLKVKHRKILGEEALREMEG